MATSEARPTRWEWLWLLIIVLTGLALRAVHVDRIAVEHFDEGVYAADWYCQPPGLPEGQFPRQHLYAPPLLPNLCFWTIFFADGDPHAVVWINIVAGTLTIPLLWWIGRTWFGPASGLFAAALCAFSDLHIAFSRTVLTDVLLVLFLAAGVWVGTRAIQTGRPLWIVLGGVLAGLAWWTKYNGWLTLAITAAGLAGWLVFERPRGTPVWPLLFRWLAMAIIAAVIWSPVPWGLQDHGGYAAVSANHARYFVGWTGWWESLRTQFVKLHHFESWLGVGLCIAGLVVTRLACWTLPAGPRTQVWSSNVVRAVLYGAVLLGLTVTFEGIVISCGWLGMVAMLRVWWDRRAVCHTTDDHCLGSLLPVWVTWAWFWGLLFAVPLYTPYPRLTLPLVTVVWLLASNLWSMRHSSPADAPDNWRTQGVIMGCLLCFGLIAAIRPPRQERFSPLPVVAWQDRRGLAEIATPLIAAAERDFVANPTSGRQQLKAAIYVFAEPAVFYQLAAQPKRPEFRFFAHPIGDHSLLKGKSPHPELATYIITGPHTDANPSDVAAFATAATSGRLRLIASLPYTPSDLVLLDQTDRRGLAAARRQTVRLYRRVDDL